MASMFRQIHSTGQIKTVLCIILNQRTMEDKELEKPEAAEETAVQSENGRALQDEPEKEKKVLTPEEMEKRRKFIVIPAFVLVFLGVMC